MGAVEKSSMEELSKVGIDSKRTTAASVAIVGLVVYLSMIHLQSILMPLAIAILLCRLWLAALGLLVVRTLRILGR